MKLLLVEDEEALCDMIAKSLYKSGYETDCCHDGIEALEYYGCGEYDLIVLDLNIPGMDGMDVLRTIRKDDKKTAILILSARSEIKDRVSGLDAGANDYLLKPFHLDELRARIRSLVRRNFIQTDLCFSCGDICFDSQSRTVSVKNIPIALTRKETGIIEYLLLNQGRPVSQEELLEHVWDSSVNSFSNSIRVHVSSLRKKLKSVLGYDPISNKIGEGYVITKISE